MPLGRATRLPVILTDEQEPLPWYDLLGIAIANEIEIEGAAITNLRHSATAVGLHYQRQEYVVGLRLCTGQDPAHLIDRIGLALAFDLAADHDIIHGVRGDQDCCTAMVKTPLKLDR